MALSIPDVFTNQGIPLVGIGRDSRIGGYEYLGVQAPVSSNHGGMYTNTQGVTAAPFHGYGTGGALRAWHYNDGSTGTWHYGLAG